MCTRSTSSVLRRGKRPTTCTAGVFEMPASDPPGYTPLLRCVEFVNACARITFLTRVSAHQSRLRETFQLMLNTLVAGVSG